MKTTARVSGKSPSKSYSAPTAAALALAKVTAEEDYAKSRLRRFEAERASGELEALAVAAMEDAEKRAERSAGRVAHLEEQLAAPPKKPSWVWGLSEEKHRELLAVRAS